jgi:hypothetical protein
MNQQNEQKVRAFVTAYDALVNHPAFEDTEYATYEQLQEMEQLWLTVAAARAALPY